MSDFFSSCTSPCARQAHPWFRGVADDARGGGGGAPVAFGGGGDLGRDEEDMAMEMEL